MLTLHTSRTFPTFALIAFGLASLSFVSTPNSVMATALLGTFLGGLILTVSGLNHSARHPGTSLSRVVHEATPVSAVRPVQDRRRR